MYPLLVGREEAESVEDVRLTGTSNAAASFALATFLVNKNKDCKTSHDGRVSHSNEMARRIGLTLEPGVVKSILSIRRGQ